MTGFFGFGGSGVLRQCEDASEVHRAKMELFVELLGPYKPLHPSSYENAASKPHLWRQPGHILALKPNLQPAMPDNSTWRLVSNPKP